MKALLSLNLEAFEPIVCYQIKEKLNQLEHEFKAFNECSIFIKINSLDEKPTDILLHFKR